MRVRLLAVFLWRVFVPVLENDITPDVADAFDEFREETAEGDRYFLLAAAPWDSSGVVGIALGADPNGEVTHGMYLSQGYADVELIARICEDGNVTAEVLTGLWGIAILRAGDAVAAVYECKGRPVVPKLPTRRVWAFGLTYTRQEFTPIAPGGFDYTFDSATAGYALAG